MFKSRICFSNGWLYLSILLSFWPFFVMAGDSWWAIWPTNQYTQTQNAWSGIFYILSKDGSDKREGVLLVGCEGDSLGGRYHYYIGIEDRVLYDEFHGEDHREVPQIGKCGKYFPIPRMEKRGKEIYIYFSKELELESIPQKNIYMSSFDSVDTEIIERIRGTFHPNSRTAWSRTFSLQHGRRTDEVYVFLPGIGLPSSYFLGQAIGAFLAGKNVLIGVLPGHENSDYVSYAGQNGEWLLYTEYLVRSAKRYGQKIIFVGHSTGGHLGIRMAEQGLVDGLILNRPLVGLAALQSGLLSAAKTFNAAFRDPLKTFIDLGINARKLSELSYSRVNSNVKISIRLSKLDSVVDNDKTIAWAKKNAPHAEISYDELDSRLKTLVFGHMVSPPMGYHRSFFERPEPLADQVQK